MPESLLAVNTPVVVVSFSLYTLAIVAIGLYSARFARRSDEDYFLAGRSLGGWVAALSASASSESGWVTLGLVGWAFANGVQAYWIIPGCLLGYLFNWFVVAGRMSDRAKALQALTLPDFFAFSFRERVPLLRVLSVIVILVAMLLYVSAQLAAAGKAFSTAFERLDYSYGVLIGAGIVLVYTVSGGFRAVCWTDFLQALLMAGTLIVFPAYLLIEYGGYGFVTTQLSALAPEAGQPGDLLRFIPDMAGPALLGFLLGHGALGINFGYPGQPHVLVRFLALRDRKDARVAGAVAFAWGLFVYWGAVTIGLFARSLAAAGETWTAAITADGEVSLVVSAMHLLPGVTSGLVLAAVLAAICSTADSQLVVAASSGANDLYARLTRRPENPTELRVTRLVVGVMGITAALTMLVGISRVFQLLEWRGLRDIGQILDRWLGPAPGADAPPWSGMYNASLLLHMLLFAVSALVLSAIVTAISRTAPAQRVRTDSAGAGGPPMAGDAEEGRGAHPWVNRLFVAWLGIVAVLLVIGTRVKVYEYVLSYGWAILGASFGPQVILLLLWKRASYAGCLAGMLVGFVTAILWKALFDNQVGNVEIYNLPLAFVAALIVNIVVSLVVPSPARAGAPPTTTSD